jgi:hypothetical protein
VVLATALDQLITMNGCARWQNSPLASAGSGRRTLIASIGSFCRPRGSGLRLRGVETCQLAVLEVNLPPPSSDPMSAPHSFRSPRR